jgi:uncharacterized protein
MAIATEQTLREITAVIVREVDPVRIVLFGSYGRGEAHEDSDLDILIYSEAEAERWRSSLNHVVGRALREGKVVYERP